MTISSTTNRVSVTGNGVATAFAFPYKFLANADLVVIETVIATGAQTTKTLNTDYTVTGAGDPSGGTVTAVTAPASTVTWTIYRDPPLTQGVDLVNGDSLDVDSEIEAPLDRLTMIAQRLADRIGRSLRQPEGDTAVIDALPAKVSRASRYLAFDANGNPVATAGTTSDIVTTAFIATLLDDADAATARATLGAAASSDLAALRGYLAGCKLSNGTDATNDIDVAAGTCRDDTNTVTITLSAITKQLDAAFAAGTNAGGRDTGAIANGTWHVFAIAKADGTSDVLFSTSASSPTMPTGYTYKRRIGSILRESAAIVGFTQDGDRFIRNATALDVNVSTPGSSAVTRTLSTPGGVRMTAIVRLLTIDTSGGGIAALLSYLSANDEAPSTTNAQVVSPAASTAAAAEVQVQTNTSSQIRSRTNSALATTSLEIRTIGWIDTRGRFD